MGLYVALKKTYDEEGELAGFSSKFEVMAQDEIDEMEDEDLDGYFLIPIKEAVDCKTRRYITRGTRTIN